MHVIGWEPLGFSRDSPDFQAAPLPGVVMYFGGGWFFVWCNFCLLFVCLFYLFVCVCVNFPGNPKEDFQLQCY